MNDKVLDVFVKTGILKDYKYRTLDMDGMVTTSNSGFRETEQVVLTFANGEVLVIDTFCSGSNENTSLIFSSPQVK